MGVVFLVSGPTSGGCQTEVQDLDPSIRAELDIRRLEISVYDSSSMGCPQALAKLKSNSDHFVKREGAPRDNLVKIFPVDQLHDENMNRLWKIQGRRDFIGGFVIWKPEMFEAVEGRNIRVVQRGKNPRLVLKTGVAFGVPGEIPGQYLECNVSTESGVLGAPDLAHGAVSKAALDLIVAKSQTSEVRRRALFRPERPILTLTVSCLHSSTPL